MRGNITFKDSSQSEKGKGKLLICLKMECMNLLSRCFICPKWTTESVQFFEDKAHHVRGNKGELTLFSTNRRLKAENSYASYLNIRSYHGPVS